MIIYGSLNFITVALAAKLIPKKKQNENKEKKSVSGACTRQVFLFSL